MRRKFSCILFVLVTVSLFGNGVLSSQEQKQDEKQKTADMETRVRIAGKNHYIKVKAWIANDVIKLTNASTDERVNALLQRLLVQHEQYLDVVTKGGKQIRDIRFYVGVPHKVEGEHLHDFTATSLETSAKPQKGCVTNYICVTWDNPKYECCASWKCCDLE
jgi:hypothetical protein